MARLSDSIAVTASVLKKGQPAIFPTETVYGLGVSIRHAASPDILYSLKRREKAKPISWLVSLATTSANVSGKRPAGSFGDLDEGLCSQVSAVLSDGEDGAKSGVASTVVDCTQDHPVIVREGAITIADIKSLS